jgi:hypothetical protein
MMTTKNPLNGRGTAMMTAAPVVFGVSEAIFHANPFVGGALAILGGAIAYRHYDDVASGVETLKEGALHDYTPKHKATSPTYEVARTEQNIPDFRDIPIPIGVERNGKRFERSMRQLKSVLILGLQEGGKSNTAIHIARHLAKNGAHIAIIDKHARSEEDSLTSKMKPLEKRFECNVGDSPISSMKVVAHVRDVLNNRLEGGKCSYPLFLIVDEYTAIIRQKEDGGPWQACGKELAALIEDINTEGRKHQIFAICIGQIANVSRTGGSEVREVFATRIVHGMSKTQANLVGFTEVNKQIEALDQGECFIQTRGVPHLWLKIPYVEEQALRKLAKSLPPIEKGPSYEEVNRNAFSAIDPDVELACMEDVDLDDSRYEEDFEEERPTTKKFASVQTKRLEVPSEQLVEIGKDNITKEPVCIPQSTFDLLVNAARVGSPMSIKTTQALLQCSEQHAKNVSERVRECLSE